MYNEIYVIISRKSGTIPWGIGNTYPGIVNTLHRAALTVNALKWTRNILRALVFEGLI